MERWGHGPKPPKPRRETYPALFEDPVNLPPPRIFPLQLNPSLPQLRPQRIRGFPSMVMRDLAVYVMRNVRLGDPMGERCRQPSHNGAQVAQKVPVVRRQRASWEGELAGTVVREEGIGVLEEGDQNDPVVDPTNEKRGQRWRIERWQRTCQR